MAFRRLPSAIISAFWSSSRIMCVFRERLQAFNRRKQAFNRHSGKFLGSTADAPPRCHGHQVCDSASRPLI